MQVLRAAVCLVALAAGVPSWAADGGAVRGRVIDPDGLPLPGVVVTLTSAGGASSSAVTGATGDYSMAAAQGPCHLAARLAGFDAFDLDITITASVPLTVDIHLRLAGFAERVDVRAAPSQAVLGPPQPDAPVTATRDVVDSSMLPNSQYDDVLPLLPNVVRGPDGTISVAGASASSAGLVVNGSNSSDPIGGEAIMLLPLEAVDAVEVFTGGYPADAGRSTGGVTSVRTRSGADEWHVSANSFFPRLLFAGSTPHGVESWEPNGGASGPLVRGRLFAESAISYRYDRNRYDTLGGEQVSRYRALMSWSQLDLKVSPTQHVAASISLDPQSTDRAGISAFTGPGSVPALDRGGWTAGVGDRLTIGRDTMLEVRAGIVGSRLVLTPDGFAPYELGHESISGSCFDRRDLQGRRVEAAAAVTWTAPGGHQVRVGTTVGRISVDGREDAGRTDYLRSDGTISSQVTFAGPPANISTSASEIGAFAQDRWKPSSGVTLDAGVRYDRTAGGGAAVSPRVAWTLALPGGRTTVGGSAGLFADKIPLAALAFEQSQARVVQSWDDAGIAGAARLFTNTIGGTLETPVATRWDAEIDHRFDGGWQVRVRYQERRGSHEFVVDPVVTSDTTGALVLSATGRSRARSVEATFARHVPRTGDEICLSYVRSASSGNVNTLDAVNGVARDPLVLPDQVAPLRADVPNRLLAWGILHLPQRVTVAPFVEIRDGFPYSAVDDSWNYAGPALGRRLPWFGTLDLYVNRIFSVSRRLPDARIGLKLYNLASVHTERDVQRDVARANFGRTCDPIPRDFTFVFELLWGRK